MSRPDSSHHYGFSPLAGVTAGTASILLCFGVLALAWHRVAGQVSTGITVLVYVMIATVCGLAFAALFYVFLWLRHRFRHPELLAGRHAVRAEIGRASADFGLDQAVTSRPSLDAVSPASKLPAIEPPRVYLNVTPGQLAALMQHYAEGERS